jgi:predicted HicB family RNase H-like nuclease|tara:strand:+ start:385 stop:600 length:216 start_codon:yes stop_codon:yes gene_type:complete
MYSKCVTFASSLNRTNHNRGKEKMKKDKQINIRITNALHEQLAEAANNKGLKLSAYICDALVKQLQDNLPQ